MVYSRAPAVAGAFFLKFTNTSVETPISRCWSLRLALSGDINQGRDLESSGTDEVSGVTIALNFSNGLFVLTHQLTSPRIDEMDSGTSLTTASYWSSGASGLAAPRAPIIGRHGKTIDFYECCRCGVMLDE